MRDFVNGVDVVQALAPATVTANTSGLTVDLRGCNAVGFTVFVDNTGDTLSGTNKFTIGFDEADDDGAGSPAAWTPVPALKVIVQVGGSLIVAAKNARYEAGCLSIKRYVRLTLTAAGTHTSGSGVFAVAARGHLLAEGKGW